jgi:hypothetical protein
MRAGRSVSRTDGRVELRGLPAGDEGERGVERVDEVDGRRGEVRRLVRLVRFHDREPPIARSSVQGLRYPHTRDRARASTKNMHALVCQWF